MQILHRGAFSRNGGHPVRGITIALLFQLIQSQKARLQPSLGVRLCTVLRTAQLVESFIRQIVLILQRTLGVANLGGFPGQWRSRRSFGAATEGMRLPSSSQPSGSPAPGGRKGAWAPHGSSTTRLTGWHIQCGLLQGDTRGAISNQPTRVFHAHRSSSFQHIVSSNFGCLTLKLRSNPSFIDVQDPRRARVPPIRS